MFVVKKIISFFCVFAILFSLPVTGLAADMGADYKQQSDFWTWLAGGNSLLNDLIGYTTGAVCPKSEDGYHHASSYMKSHDDGLYTCICDACGDRFVGYLSDAQQSYADQIAELPATGVTSSGGLLYNPLDYPALTDVDTYQGDRVSLSSFPFVSGEYSYSLVSGSYSHIDLVFKAQSPSNCSNKFYIYPVAPVSGVYTVVSQPKLTWYMVRSDGIEVNFDSTLDSKDFNTIPSSPVVTTTYPSTTLPSGSAMWMPCSVR